MGKYIETHGISIIEGEPGGGKSLFGVDLLLESIREHRRPVFTNLPLRWQTVRAWLHRQGGDELADLLFELGQQHFRAFIDRVAQLQEFTDARRVGRKRRGDLRKVDLNALFVNEYGPNVLEDEWDDNGNKIAQANWIPPGAVILIDEAHHWFPMQDQQKRKETQSLQTYLTMHRHLRHTVFFATQRERQLTITAKSLARLWYTCRDKAHDRVIWGMKVKHLGVRCLGRACFHADQIQDTKTPLEDRRPIFDDVIWHTMKCERWKFRLYSSETHAGDRRQLDREQQAILTAAGLDEKGRMKREREDTPVKEPRRLLRTLRTLCVAGLIGSAAYAFGAANGGGTPDEQLAADAPPELEWSRYSIRLPDGIIYDGRIIAPLEDIEGGRLLYVNADDTAFIRRDGWVWRLELGSEVGTPVGRLDQVTSRIRDAAAAFRDRDRSAERTGRDDTPRAVGHGLGHDQRDTGSGS